MISRIVGNDSSKQRSGSQSVPRRGPPRFLGYSPYGYCSRLQSILGFNGEHPDPVTGYYPLGNGHRAFNPSLMRFICPDRMSPFAAGGLNAYAYCQGDPVNFQDPSGQMLSARTSRWGPPKPPPAELAGYKMIGFHGSSNMHMDSLRQGPKEQFLKRSKYGTGFYVTPISKMARHYADGFNEGGPRYLGSYKVAGQSKPSYGRVYTVYAKNTESWRLDIDYSYIKDSKILIRSSVFGDVKIHRQASSSGVTDIRTGKVFVHPSWGRGAASSSASFGVAVIRGRDDERQPVQSLQSGLEQPTR